MRREQSGPGQAKSGTEPKRRYVRPGIERVALTKAVKQGTGGIRENITVTGSRPLP